VEYDFSSSSKEYISSLKGTQSKEETADGGEGAGGEVDQRSLRR